MSQRSAKARIRSSVGSSRKKRRVALALDRELLKARVALGHLGQRACAQDIGELAADRQNRDAGKAHELRPEDGHFLRQVEVDDGL